MVIEVGDLSTTDLSAGEKTTQLPLIIWPSLDRVTLPANAYGLYNIDHA